MKNLSQWASRYAPLAIALIIGGEVVNGFNGFVLGAGLLDTLSVAGHAGVAVLVSLAVGVRLLARMAWVVFASDDGACLAHS